MTALLETQRLTKRYGSRRGCQNVSLKVQAGHIFGLLGPNGAGKSTFVKMIVGLLQPTAGEAHLSGYPCGSVQAKRKLGYLPELFRYPEWLTGAEVLRFHARLAELASNGTEARIHEALKLVGLEKQAAVRVRHYSKGMQQRLGIANALLHDPELVLLDEPSSALDPIGRHEIRLLLGRLREQGKTVFLNTHLLEDVEALCDEVAFLHEGDLMVSGPLDELLRGSGGWELKVGGWIPNTAAQLEEELGAGCRLHTIQEGPLGDATVIAEGVNREQLGLLNMRLIQLGVTLYEVQRQRRGAGLEDWFLQMIRQSEKEDTV